VGAKKKVFSVEGRPSAVLGELNASKEPRGVAPAPPSTSTGKKCARSSKERRRKRSLVRARRPDCRGDPERRSSALLQTPACHGLPELRKKKRGRGKEEKRERERGGAACAGGKGRGGPAPGEGKKDVRPKSLRKKRRDEDLSQKTSGTSKKLRFVKKVLW